MSEPKEAKPGDHISLMRAYPDLFGRESWFERFIATSQSYRQAVVDLLRRQSERRSRKSRVTPPE